jgi:hypothetical protein
MEAFLSKRTWPIKINQHNGELYLKFVSFGNRTKVHVTVQLMMGANYVLD